jgi:GNAT superfamily N-acetyltransferase
VAVTPEGRLAGFLIGWLDEARQLAQIESMGVHPDFCGIGLARALLFEGLRRFQAHGAIEAIVETESGRSPCKPITDTPHMAGSQATHVAPHYVSA